MVRNGLKGFSDYLIFYRLLNDDRSLTIEVLRVIHGARDLVALFQDEFDRGDGMNDRPWAWGIFR